MKHLSDEELVALFYGEADADAGGHLARCAQCTAAMAMLRADIEALTPVQPLPVGNDCGERIWQALAPQLIAHEPQPRFWLRLSFWPAMGYAVACLLLLAMTFASGRLFERRQKTQLQTPHADTARQIPAAPREQQRGGTPDDAQPRVLVVVLGDHLERSERLLVELKHADSDRDELAPVLKVEAQSLLAANANCQQQARKLDDPELGQALDHLGKVLTEIADQRGELDDAAIHHLQTEMESEHLLFEVRVLRSSIPDGHAGKKTLPAGGTI
jgi:hypothetical protein